MSKLLKYILIVVGIGLAIWFVSSKIKACNVEKDKDQTHQPYVEDYKKLRDSLAASKRREDSAAYAAAAFKKSADSVIAIKNHVEKDLFASKSRADRLAAENDRLKKAGDTPGQLENCDALASEVKTLSTELTQYKDQSDKAIALKDSIISAEIAQKTEAQRSRDKIDSVYKRIYVYNQSLFTELQKTTKKANKTVNLSLSGGAGVPLTGVIKTQPFVGITISKTLLRLW